MLQSDLNNTKERLIETLKRELPGERAQRLMLPQGRQLYPSTDTKGIIQSSVLMLLFPYNKKINTCLIQRPSTMRNHAGQIAFPGGRYEEEDIDVRTTALREIQEEIGITEDKIEIIGRLTDIYVPPSNFLISVFVGYLAEKPQYKMDEREVAEIIEIPFNDFYKSGVIKQKDFYVNSLLAASNAPYFDVTNAEIWGASAMVISELLDVLQLQEF